MHVAISQKLYDDTRKQIDSMCQAEIAALKLPHEIELSPESPLGLHLLWGEHVNLRNLVPQSWLKVGNTVSAIAEVLAYDEDGKPKLAMREYSLLFTLPDKTPMPLSVPNSRYSNDKHTRIQPGQFTEVDDHVRKLQARDSITDRWHSVRKQVLEFLDSCKSLNEAMKLFPQIRPYIPTEFIKRLETKVERSKGTNTEAMEKLKSLDINALASSAVLARLASSS